MIQELTEYCSCGRCRPACLAAAMHDALHQAILAVERTECPNHNDEDLEGPCFCSELITEIHDLIDQLTEQEAKHE